MKHNIAHYINRFRLSTIRAYFAKPTINTHVTVHFGGSMEIELTEDPPHDWCKVGIPHWRGPVHAILPGDVRDKAKNICPFWLGI